MITASSEARQPAPPGWQREMASAICTPEDLIAALGLDLALVAPAHAGAAHFRLRVPRSYVARMRRGDPHDPLLRQVLPVAEEREQSPAYGADPLGERQALRAPGLLQKYRGRGLLITTAACAVHCRYCFRREFPYSERTGEAHRWAEALQEIAGDASIEEVILSGGDPLSLSDARLATLTDALARIPHVKRLRVHTRHPIVLPSRVDAGLIGWLEALPWCTVFVLHANHANEIDHAVRTACARLKGCGATLLNQSVLLRGVNDDAEALAHLSEKLFEAGVLPYYLHLLDRVSGTAHFDIPEPRAQELLGELAARLPGYLVPRLVREIEGAPAKVPLPPRFAAM
jgi:EF-P beta-lysylation protein EpmB